MAIHHEFKEVSLHFYFFENLFGTNNKPKKVRFLTSLNSTRWSSPKTKMKNCKMVRKMEKKKASKDNLWKKTERESETRLFDGYYVPPFSSHFSSACPLVFSYTFTHAKEQVSQSNQRATLSVGGTDGHRNVKVLPAFCT